MRDRKRIGRILGKVETLWEDYPDLRFNQMIHNLSWDYSNKNNGRHKNYGYSKFENDTGDIVFHKDVVSIDLYNIEDDGFEIFLDEMIRER